MCLSIESIQLWHPVASCTVCPEWVQGDRTWHWFAISSPTNCLALRSFPSDWTKFLWKATRACGWHKVISRFSVTLKWYATCPTVNSPLPVRDRNWLGWGPAKWVFQLMWARAPKQVTSKGNQNQEEFRLLQTVMVFQWLSAIYCWSVEMLSTDAGDVTSLER